MMAIIFIVIKPVLGFGFGGETGSFRLWVDKDFAVGSTRAVDVTFRKGYFFSSSNTIYLLSSFDSHHIRPLMDDFDFEIEDIVVWGLGGEGAEQRQEKERMRERA